MAEAFKGMTALIEDMRNLPKELEGEASKHIQAEANGMESELKQNYARVTGNLARGVGQQRKGHLRIDVRSRAPHAHLYEFGTVERTRASGGRTGTMPAKPTFIPAKWRHLKRLNARFREMLRRAKVRGMTGSAT